MFARSAAHFIRATARGVACLLSLFLLSSTLSACASKGRSTLRVMVTNDDGVAAAGLDALVEALRGLQPPVEVSVIAPAQDQTNVGCSATGGAISATATTTASGYPAMAVAGTPVDTIVYAIDQDGLPKRPHLVISGINRGQNLGQLIEMSGTVSAARAAGARGVPALAVSQGRGDAPDFPSAVRFVRDWIAENREALLSADEDDAPIDVTSLNVPTCTEGTVRGLARVPLAADAVGALGAAVCTSTAENPITDIEGFLAGFATLSTVSPGCQGTPQDGGPDGGAAHDLGTGMEVDGMTCFAHTNWSSYGCSDLGLDTPCTSDTQCVTDLDAVCFLFDTENPSYQKCIKGTLGACDGQLECGQGGRCCQWEESFGTVHGCKCL